MEHPYVRNPSRHMVPSHTTNSASLLPAYPTLCLAPNNHVTSINLYNRRLHWAVAGTAPGVPTPWRDMLCGFMHRLTTLGDESSAHGWCGWRAGSRTWETAITMGNRYITMPGPTISTQ